MKKAETNMYLTFTEKEYLKISKAKEAKGCSSFKELMLKAAS